mmetsp:Transcript_9491/g.11674  ORF Transcript_9491/g.11674 Transcript_9491/m.11674 type:complete len:84 (-) Transcript_9491:273-524(-)
MRLIVLFLVIRYAYGMSVEVSRSALKQALALPLQELPKRRDVLVSTSVAALLRVAAVDASGGATAGGAYLLRAKERYSERVSS